MNRTAVKIFRFVFNIAMFSLVLMSVTYFMYTVNPELFGLKNALVPFSSALVLVCIIAAVLSVVNEVVTLVVVKWAKRGKNNG